MEKNAAANEFLKEIKKTGTGETAWIHDIIEFDDFKVHGGASICENFCGINISGTDDRWNDHYIYYQVQVFDKNGLISQDSRTMKVSDLKKCGSLGTFYSSSYRNSVTEYYEVFMKVQVTLNIKSKFDIEKLEDVEEECEGTEEYCGNQENNDSKEKTEVAFSKEVKQTGTGETAWIINLIEFEDFKVHGGASICENFCGINISGTDERWNNHNINYKVQVFDKNGLIAQDSRSMQVSKLKGCGSLGTFYSPNYRNSITEYYEIYMKVEVTK